MAEFEVRDVSAWEAVNAEPIGRDAKLWVREPGAAGIRQAVGAGPSAPLRRVFRALTARVTVELVVTVVHCARTGHAAQQAAALLDARLVLVAVLVFAPGNVDRVVLVMPTAAGSPTQPQNVGQDRFEQRHCAVVIHSRSVQH